MHTDILTEKSIDGFGFDKKIRKEINSRLRALGPHKFMEEQLSYPSVTPILLGTAFGIEPSYYEIYGREFYMRLLSRVIRKACTKRQKLPQYNTIDDAAKLLRESKNISEFSINVSDLHRADELFAVVITGAGISTSLGIPDFRSKDTGFYTKLLAMGIEEPEEVFDIHEFDFNPRTFYELAGDILPDLNFYSPTHGFIRLLQDMGKLQTNYTQNIDNLEELAGIDRARLIQCHGSFATATCRLCGHRVKGTEIFADMRAKRVSKCRRCTARIAAAEAAPKPKKRKPTPHGGSSDDDVDDNIPSPGVMKPDITFFGEQLPDNFFDRFTEKDSKTVDLVVVIGTSLKVAPVSEMPNHLPEQVPHIYISREPVEHVNFDVQLLGSCDDVVFELCRRAGWELKHEMLPMGMKVKVDKVEDSVCRWRVKREGGDVNGKVL